MKNSDKKVIGWREYVDLPEWGIHDLRAKIDTGARTCSLHVEDIEELPHGKIGFYVVLNLKPKRRRHMVARSVKRGHVKSSVGHRTHRWYVQTTIKIGKVIKDVTVNLVERPGMNFRMLIGRKAIEDDFLVDVDHSFYLGQPKKKSKDSR
ncbi:MAG: ATP-dependent zinc protease [Candidatus Omnitrophica bacterium]|nr:ATP-dependent zinc protease [Candidatus Omnitrophota bacterium]